MFSNLRDIITASAGAAVAFAIVSIYWLGLPLMNDRSTIAVPFYGDLNVSAVPVLGPLAVGHLQLCIDQAVTAATADMVKRVELEAVRGQLVEAKRQQAAGAAALEEHRKRADAAQAQAARDETQREQERVAYAIRLDQAQRSCNLDDVDIEWLLRHDGKPPG